MKVQLVATCLFGLEKLLGEELDALGLRRIKTMDGRVIFEGEERDIARPSSFIVSVCHFASKATFGSVCPVAEKV